MFTVSLQEALETMLPQFTGTMNYYRHWMPHHYYTDGVNYLAEKAGAYWLIDAIVSHQHNPKVRREPFQVWTLHVASKSPYPVPENIAAILICTDGGKGGEDDLQVELARQNIKYTDFPLEKITLYLEEGSLDGEHLCKILMLPSER